MFSNYSDVFNFTLRSLLSVTLANNGVNFGNLNVGNESNTTDDVPQPFLVVNSGNVPLNITVTSQRLFTSGSFPSTNYRFKARANETNSFNSTNSTLSFTNFTNSSSAKDVFDLNWTDSNDDARIDVQVVVPTDEPGGIRNTTCTVAVAS